MEGTPENNPGTFLCLFCSGVISLRNGDSEKFRMHMEVYHQVFSHSDILLALNFLKEEERSNIVNATKNRIEKAKQIAIQVKQEIVGFLDPDVDFEYDDDNIDNIDNSNDEKLFVEEMDSSEEITSMDKSADVFDGEDYNSSLKKETLSCHICQRTFIESRLLLRHTRNKICLKYHDCKMCGKKWKESSKLKRHMKIKRSCVPNDNINDEEMKPPVIVNEVNSLKVSEIFQTYNESNACEICQKRFKDLKFLHNHIRKKVCLKYHACAKCGKKFKTSSKLKMHIIDKKFSCGDRNIGTN